MFFWEILDHMIYTFTNITSQLDTITVVWVFSFSIMLFFIEDRWFHWAGVVFHWAGVVLVWSTCWIWLLLVITVISPGVICAIILIC